MLQHVIVAQPQSCAFLFKIFPFFMKLTDIQVLLKKSMHEANKMLY